MGNFSLQTSPCSFLKLRISPWEIPSVLLLSSSLSWRLLSFSFPTGGSSIKIAHFLPLSLSVPSSAGSTGGAARWARGAAGSGGAGAATPSGAARARRAPSERAAHRSRSRAGGCGSARGGLARRPAALAGGSGASQARERAACAARSGSSGVAQARRGSAWRGRSSSRAARRRGLVSLGASGAGSGAVQAGEPEATVQVRGSDAAQEQARAWSRRADAGARERVALAVLESGTGGRNRSWRRRAAAARAVRAQRWRVSGTTQEQEWSPGPGRAGVSGARACAGMAPPGVQD
jgi:hypothetical protein